MTQIQLHGEVSDTLSSLSETSELLNEQGQVVGFFTPAKLVRLPLFGNITNEELQRRRQEPAMATLADIWKSLGVTP